MLLGAELSFLPAEVVASALSTIRCCLRVSCSAVAADLVVESVLLRELFLEYVRDRQR